MYGDDSDVIVKTEWQEDREKEEEEAAEKYLCGMCDMCTKPTIPHIKIFDIDLVSPLFWWNLHKVFFLVMFRHGNDDDDAHILIYGQVLS